MLDGMHSIDGVLDAETAGRLGAALAPFLVPHGPDDVRTTDQRRADALSEVVDAAVKSGELPWLSGSSVALQVDVPLVTLTGDAPEPARLSATTKTPVWFTPEAAQRMACDRLSAACSWTRTASHSTSAASRGIQLGTAQGVRRSGRWLSLPML